MKGHIIYEIQRIDGLAEKEFTYPAVYTHTSYNGTEDYTTTVGVSKPVTSSIMESFKAEERRRVKFVAFNGLRGNITIYEIDGLDYCVHLDNDCIVELLIHRSSASATVFADRVEDFFGIDTLTGLDYWILRDVLGKEKPVETSKDMEIKFPAIYRDSFNELYLLLCTSYPVSRAEIFGAKKLQKLVVTHNMESSDNMSIYVDGEKFVHCDEQYNKPVIVTRSVYGLQEAISENIDNYKSLTRVEDN